MSETPMDRAILYSPKYEAMPREELEQLQIERLQSTLNRVYRNVAFYHTAFDSHAVNLERLKEVRALRELPFTRREDLRKSYPYDMFAVPLHDIVRIHSTSGVAGAPVIIGYTRNDLRNWTECTARLLAAVGVTEHDVVQIALNYSLSAGAFGFQQGAEQIGATVIPASLTMDVEKQIAIMRDFKATALIATPSHGINLSAALEQMQIHPERLHLRLGLFGGERLNDPLRRQLEERLRVTTIDTYGLTEIMGPGTAGECHIRDGFHVNEDHFLVEVIDPQTGEPVPTGEEGELVLTTITREGFPLIRYRTGDVTKLIPEPCPCGRTFVRMARIMGRTDDLILFRGVAFFPSQIEEILSGVEGTSPYYQIILDEQGSIDTIEVRAEVSDKIPFLDEVKAIEALRVQIATRIRTALDIEAKVTFVEPRSLRQLTAGKDRIVDKRPR